MKKLLIIFAVCALAAAMVPRERRDITEEEEEETTTAKTSIECAHQTPCAWSVYQPRSKVVMMNITNTYCYCPNGTECIMNEDDTGTNTFVYRCRPPTDDAPSFDI